MQIPPFYVHQRIGEKSCSDDSKDDRGVLLYQDEKSCKNADGVWDFLPPYGWEEYDIGNYHADEHGQDFYWTGVHRMSFDTGPHGDYSYQGAYGSSSSYKAGDMVSVQGNEKVFYYALSDGANDSTPSNDGTNWEQVHLKSYVYGGVDGTLDP